MTNFLRSALRPRVVRPLLPVIVSAALLCTAFVLGATLSRSDIVVTTPAVTIPAPLVTVTPAPVVLPAPVAVEAPPAPAAVEQPPAPQPRALVPKLDPACVIMSFDSVNPICTWDDGFPAISADGTLIATRFSPPTGPSSFYGLSIHFIDAKTSRLVRDTVILALGEADQSDAPDNGDPNDEKMQARRRLQTTIDRRVAAVQRTLDAKQFRSMVSLGSSHSTLGSDDPETARGPETIYAEILGTTARVIDSEARTVLWRGDFGVAGPKRSDDDTSDCGGMSLWSIALWWDPATRFVLAGSTYRTGGCMCRDLDFESVKQMPR
jgi:hypothetical protein